MAEADLYTFHFAHPFYMVVMQYAVDLFLMSCKVISVYNESEINYIFNEEVDSFVRHNLPEVRGMQFHTDITHTAFKAQLLQATENVYDLNQLLATASHRLNPFLEIIDWNNWR